MQAEFEKFCQITQLIQIKVYSKIKSTFGMISEMTFKTEIMRIGRNP